MKTIKLALLTAAVALFVIACNNTTNTNQTTGTNTQPSPPASPSATTAPTPADEFAALRPVYAESCARCHKIDGEGGTVEVLGKKLKVPSLKKGHALNHSDADLAKQISEGEDGMPAFKDKLSKEQIDGLVRFIRKEFQSGATTGKETTPPAPKS